jgi:two-component system, LytTR family, response regulator
MRFMKTYVRGKGGSVIMKDGTELEVSQRRKSEFLVKLGV